ncbi:MAG: hypothetical protein FD137_198 [Spirochaetes bacterium]|nr:MAG: hypothetical protein FD137_198 [Spirochaetota bacterium]
MKRKTFSSLIFALALFSITLWSCDSLFVNQFAKYGLGQVDMEELKDSITAVATDGPAIIETSGILDAGVTKTFIQAVTSDPVLRDQVFTTLKNTALDNAVPLPQREAAAVIIVEILIAETGETDLLQNMIAAAASFDFTGFDINNPADLNRLLDALLPEGAKAVTYPDGWDGARLASLLDALNDMGSDFEALAGIIADNQGTLTNLNLDAGWYAQVGTLVRVLNALELQPTNPAAPPSGTVDTVGKAIVYILENENPQTNVELMFGDIRTIEDELAADTVLIQLFSAAGIDLQAILEMVG